jgi:aminopeptidase N
MRTEQPKMIYLKDYQAPEYLIDETHLTFELFEDHSLVHAQLVMRRNPSVVRPAAAGARRPAAGTAVGDAGRPELGGRLPADRQHLTLHPTSAPSRSTPA